MKTHVEAFEKILNRPMEKYVCKRCGAYQVHTVVYCKGCGDKFTYKPKTYFGAILAMYHRGYQNKPFLWYPNFIGAIHNRELKKEFNVDLKKEFAEYIQNKLDNN